MAGYLKGPPGGMATLDPTPASGTPSVQKGELGAPQTNVVTAGPSLERRRLLPGAPVSVLLVEDEPVLLRTTQRLLEHRGFSVVGVDTAEAALDLLSSGRSFDLLMTDVGLRRENGMELARRARLSRPALRVLFVSGSDAASVGLECHAGPDAFLEKPYTGRELDDRLRDLLLPERAAPSEKAVSVSVTARDRVR
jgi:DNA-binding response OmpR family regulator